MVVPAISNAEHVSHMITADAPVVVGKTVDRKPSARQNRASPTSTVRARVAGPCDDAARADDGAAERFANRGGHHDAPA